VSLFVTFLCFALGILIALLFWEVRSTDYGDDEWPDLVDPEEHDEGFDEYDDHG
jgi:nitrogen fixation-related uncharacterized protein